MKIEKLYLENFKCFSKADIDFGKITLLTGANSSGKSSILYAILGAIQSNEFPLQFSPNGKYVNMGDYEQMVFRNDESKNIRIDLQVSGESIQSYPFNYRIDTLWRLDKFNKPILEQLKFNSPSESILDIKNENGKDIYVHFNDEIKVFKSIQEMWKGYEGYLRHRFDKIKWGEFIRWNSSLNFISPFRLYPERTYYERTQTQFRVGKFGENYIDQLLLWESEEAPEFEKVAKILKQLNLVSEIQSNRIAGGRFELLVKTAPNSVWSSLSDVGFGISQFMPVIVADTQLGKGSTLFLAQPEIHLHPSVQADLGTYFVNQANENDKNYVIETHSEYVLNRIRLEIAKGNIAEEDVKVYFLENDGQEATIHRLNFAKNGQIENAPANFFQTYMMDVMDIALTAE